MGLDLELAASFVALVDKWGYGRAAKSLHVSIPTLTKRVQRLERQLGVHLLERGPEGLTGLTPAGMDFARSARLLLRQAHAVQVAVREKDAVNPRDRLRVGVPMGSGSFVAFMGLAEVGKQVREAFPRLVVKVVEVPFPLINRCLPETYVDLLLTIAPVKHRAVESAPLPLTATRIGVVSDRHVLAEAGGVGLAEFCEHRLLWNPTLPEEWMRPFWFGELRTQREARLTATHCSSNERVLSETQRGEAAIVTLCPDRTRLPAGLQEVKLKGSKPVRFYAAIRRQDQRPSLRSYLHQLCVGQAIALR